ncbi:MAG: NUDIX domain-containing protein [bacterium]
MTPFKFCPVCGSDKLEEINDHLLICQACKFEWYQNPKPASNVILLNSKSEMLLGKRKYPPNSGLWGTIGGFVDLNETLEQAVCRETQEELGITIEPENLTYFTSNIDRYKFQDWEYFTMGTLFTYRLSDSQISQIKPGDDVSGVEFFSVQNIPWSELAFESTIKCLKKYADSVSLNEDLDILRQKIDLLDKQLLSTLASRREAVKFIGKIKIQQKIAIHQPGRWQQVLQNLKVESDKLGLDFEIIQKVWETIHMDSLRVEKKQG